jgi:hypothetical protein
MMLVVAAGKRRTIEHRTQKTGQNAHEFPPASCRAWRQAKPFSGRIARSM